MMRTFLLIALSVQIVQLGVVNSSAPASAPATPTLVQHVSSARENTSGSVNGELSGAPTITFTLPNATLSGNCLVLLYNHNSAVSTSSVTTSAGDTLTAGPALTSGSYETESYYGIATAGSTNVKVLMSADSSSALDAGGTLSEFYNTSCTTDVTGSNATTAKSVSLTTTLANDLIWEGSVAQSATATATSPLATSITRGSGYTMLSANNWSGIMAQFQVISGTGSQTAAFTSSDSTSWNTLAIALKASSTGTAPSGTAMRIKRLMSENYGLGGSSSVTHTMNIPCDGNLIVGAWTSASVTITSSTTSSPSNTWTVETSGTSSGDNPINNNTSGAYSQIFWAANASCSNTATVSPVYSGSDTGGYNGYNLLVVLDIVNANTSQSGHVTASSNSNNTSGTSLTSSSVTPAVANGVVVNVWTIYDGTMTAVNTGAMAAAATNNKNTDSSGGGMASQLNQDDPRAVAYNSGTSSFSFIYTYQTTGQAGQSNNVMVWFHP